jgi:hypothetical protein
MRRKLQPWFFELLTGRRVPHWRWTARQYVLARLATNPLHADATQTR